MNGQFFFYKWTPGSVNTRKPLTFRLKLRFLIWHLAGRHVSDGVQSHVDASMAHHSQLTTHENGAA